MNTDSKAKSSPSSSVSIGAPSVANFVLFMVVALPAQCLAVEIEGVQPAALDQPRVNLHLRREAKGKPLSTKKLAGEETINIQAFCDTGASGIMLSKTTADALGVTRAKAGADDIVFHDIGVGGGDTFAVAEPLYVFIAPSRASGEPADADGYPLSLGPVRPQ